MTRFVSPSTGKPVQAVLFDTFGSVVDWRTGVADAVRACLQRDHADLDVYAFADAWRQKYEPSMEPVRTGERAFTTLTTLHLENLHETLAEFGVGRHLSSEASTWLNQAWERLAPWDDSVTGLSQLARTYIVGPLSNANTALLTRMAKHGGLPWDVIIGADVVQQYKPRHEVYRGIAAVLELEPGEVMLAAAHNGDLSAAQQAGLATGFIVRPREFGPAQTTDLEAEGNWDVVADDIPDLARALDSATEGDLRSADDDNKGSTTA